MISRTVLSRRSLAVVLLAAAGVLTGCSGSASPAPRSSATSTTPPASVTPTVTAPATPSTTAPPAATPVITVNGGASGTSRVRVGYTGSTTVVQAGATVTGVDAHGQQRWTIEQPADDTDTIEATVDAGAGVTVVTWSLPGDQPFPDRISVKAVDTASGRILWANTKAAFATTVQGVTFLSFCEPHQTNTVGECTISARDDRTGKERWSRETYASARVETTETLATGSLAAPSLPKVVVVHSYPSNGSTNRYEMVDAATGDERATLPSSVSSFYLTGNTVVGQRGFDEDPKDGCTDTLTGFDTDGTRLWQRTFTQDLRPAVTGEKAECAGLYPDLVASGVLAVQPAGGKSLLLDTRTGHTLWTASVAGAVQSVHGDTVVLDSATVQRAGIFFAQNRANKRSLWSEPESGAAQQGEFGVAQVGGRTVVASVECLPGDDTGRVLEAATGKALASTEGCLAGSGSDWYALATDSRVDVYRV